MKRILLLIDNMGQGGAERQLSYLAIELKKAGYDVRLVKFYGGEDFYCTDLDANGIETETYLAGKSSLKRPFAIAKLVRQWHPDMVVAYKTGTCLAACLTKLLTRFNLVVSERNTTQQLSRKERLKFFLYRLADHVVPNSFSQAEFIGKHFPRLMPRVTVITNMIDLDKFHPAVNHIEGKVLNIITAARIAPQKNVLNYLDAIALLRDRGVRAHFHWYGHLDNKPYFTEVVDKQKELGLEDMIIFHGATQDIADLYRKMDIFCLPSLYEGFPNVLCEAMACGLPAIATAVCDSARILTDTRFHADPSNPTSIADALERMITLTTKERSSIGKRNTERISGLCSAKAFSDKYLSLLD